MWWCWCGGRRRVGNLLGTSALPAHWLQTLPGDERRSNGPPPPTTTTTMTFPPAAFCSRLWQTCSLGVKSRRVGGQQTSPCAFMASRNLLFFLCGLPPACQCDLWQQGSRDYLQAFGVLRRQFPNEIKIIAMIFWDKYCSSSSFSSEMIFSDWVGHDIIIKSKNIVLYFHKINSTSNDKFHWRKIV